MKTLVKNLNVTEGDSMKTSYRGYCVYTEFLSGSLVNPSLYDQDTSEENYLDQLNDELEKAFPDADIEIATIVARKQTDFTMKTSVYDANGNLDETAVHKVEAITKTLHDNYLSWAVEKQIM